MASERWGIEELRILGMFGRGLRATRFAVHRDTGLSASTVYEMMDRFTDNGLLQPRKERVDPTLSDRAPRTVYSITPAGLQQLQGLRELLST